MNEPIWLLESVVLAIHEMLIAEHGGLSGVRDEGLLSSALTKPRQLFTYEPASSFFDLAAAYSLGLAKNHPFVDGNKRTAFTVMAVFLELNGLVFSAPEAEVVIFYEGLASGEITKSDLVAWIEKSSS